MNQKVTNLLLAAALLSSAQLSAMNNNGNMFNQGYELRLNAVRDPLDNFIAALEHCEGQLDAQRQQNTLQSVQDILSIVSIVNGQCQEALNLFIQNEEVRNEFFLLQQNAKSAQKIERMSNLFTQISQRLQNLTTQFFLLDMTSSDGQANFDNLKIALTQFLIHHNQVNDLLAGKQISIDNELDTSAVEIEIIPDTSRDEQIAQTLNREEENRNLEANMALMPELRQRKQSQQEQPLQKLVPQPNKSTRSKKRKFEALEENKEGSTLFTPNKFPKHNEIINNIEIVNNEIVNNIEDTIQMQPADENESYDLVNLPVELWAEIILNQAAINFIQKIAKEYSACGDHSPYTFQNLIQRFAQEVLYKLNATCKLFHDITQPVLNELKELLKVYPDEVPADPHEFLNKVNDKPPLTCDDLTTQNISSVIKEFLKQIAYFTPIRNFDLMINQAIRNNNKSLVSCFIASAKNPEYNNPKYLKYNWMTPRINPLNVAICHGNENMARLLLTWKDAQGDLVVDPRTGYSINWDSLRRGTMWKDSFYLALENCSVPILRLLLELHDAQGNQLINPNDYFRAKEILHAATQGDVDYRQWIRGLDMLLNEGQDSKQWITDSHSNYVEIAELLREYGLTE